MSNELAHLRTLTGGEECRVAHIESVTPGEGGRIEGLCYTVVSGTGDDAIRLENATPENRPSWSGVYVKPAEAGDPCFIVEGAGTWRLFTTSELYIAIGKGLQGFTYDDIESGVRGMVRDEVRRQLGTE